MRCLDTVRVIVTRDAERYTVVDVSGARDGVYIRRKIFEKVEVPEKSHDQYNVYQSQVGAYGMSSALSDRELFELCLQHGNPKGSLTLFVSTNPNVPS
ncbi:hypothetical protein FISHEDRAFT_74381 [Fistulina hepatica ATCC 64428]|uniref:Ras-binding domain-containing protein n=1 Tax=Fistulina hepatica ATCC 64428 TaxID=1128425 RepID=A0A0D7AAK5_9AGAR|nr:hypothetical protein FISHEDRAFT_74381 [Fistulina hepatica ATCC 64428]